jgi:formate hydrogenlyase subunit 3/multisubunit Na+/H+ antiporter MnhD subunit
MSSAALIWIWLTPLLMVPFSGLQLSKWFLVLAPLPALGIAVLATFSVYPSNSTLEIPWLLLGVVWGLDVTGRIFLLVSSLLWLAGSIYGINKPTEGLQTKRYRVFFLLSMSGNLGLIIAQDMVSFYLGFALMGLSAYGMIKPSRTQRARHAARLYLTMTILGEVALFTAIVLLAAQTDALEFVHLQNIEFFSAAIVLLIIGFGIKIGLPGLHMWMPLTYMAAPVGTVAILGSSMLNAGLLGLLRFLPPGNDSLFAWGETIVVIGLIATFYGIVIGLLQNNTRSVLAYSSISKMGTLTMGIGLALKNPQAAPLLTAAIVIYASHHAFVKSALFLGTDLISTRKSPWIFLSLCFLALVLSGAPFTSGAAAKVLLKDAIPLQWQSLTQWLLIAALATVLLMGRLLFLVWNKPDRIIGASSLDGFAKSAYFAMLLIIAAMPVVLMPLHKLLSGGVPIVIGGVLTALIWRTTPQILRKLCIDIPPGDVLVVLSWIFAQLKNKLQHLSFHLEHIVNDWNQWVARMNRRLRNYSSWSIEILLRHWELTGTLWLALCLGLIVILI